MAVVQEDSFKCGYWLLLKIDESWAQRRSGAGNERRRKVVGGVEMGGKEKQTQGGSGSASMAA